MIVTCPQCATRYQAETGDFLPDGRKVRCAKCGHVWFQPPPESEADAEDGETQVAAGDMEAAQHSAYAPTPIAARPSEFTGGTVAAQPPRTRWLERTGLAIGWLALAAIIGVIAWAALRYRQDIASLWPQSSTLYKAVGIPVNTRGIAFVDKNAHLETEDGQDVLVITGHLMNVTSHELSVPPIRVSLSDADKRELYHWSFSTGVTTLNPGQAAAFRTRLSSPPSTARHIELRFDEPGN